MTRSRIAFTLALFAGLLLAGCGPKVVPRGTVKGRVTLGSRPVTGATVFFENAETGVAMNAPLDGDGNYEVKTFEHSGLPVGSYKVAVQPGGVMSPEEASPKATEAKAARTKQAVSPIPEKYHMTATSKLLIEVKEGDNPPFDFTLEP